MWLAWAQSRGRRAEIGSLAAVAAGLTCCALTALFIQLGRLQVSSVSLSLPLLIFTTAIGFIVGMSYLWVAKAVVDSEITSSLFILGSVAGSSISLFFYFFHSEVQDAFIGIAWGYLFGVLLYLVLIGGRSGAGGIQDVFRDLVRRSRR
jgi:hypothetical protein